MKQIPIENRFWQKVDKSNPNGCWNWIASKKSQGYGMVRANGIVVGAHIAAWKYIYKKELPGGMCVLHKCDNPSCVREDHLFLGTVIENNLDRDKKNRTARGENSSCVRLTWDEVCMIRAIWNLGMFRLYPMAKAYGINQGHLWQIVNNKIWKSRV